MAFPYRKFIKPRLGTSLNKGHRLSKGLVGLWLMNEGSGTTVFDLSGNGHTGTFGNSPGWASGKYGSAIEFYGTDQYIDMGVCPEPLKLQSTDFTVVFSITGLQSTNAVICGNEYLATSGGWVIDESWNDTDMTLKIGNETQNATGLLTPGAHSVVALTFQADSKIARWYLDGTYKQQDTFSNAVGYTANRHFVVGVDPRDYISQDFTGTIDYLMIYNRALSLSEIEQLYAEPFAMISDVGASPARISQTDEKINNLASVLSSIREAVQDIIKRIQELF